jgi:hypothetical protein
MRTLTNIVLYYLFIILVCSQGHSPKQTTQQLTKAIKEQNLDEFLECFFFNVTKPEDMSDEDYREYLIKQPVVAGFVFDGFILGADDSAEIQIIKEVWAENGRKEVELCWVFPDGSKSDIQKWYFIEFDGNWKIDGELTYRSIWGEPKQEQSRDKSKETIISEGTIVPYYKATIKPKPINRGSWGQIFIIHN